MSAAPRRAPAVLESARLVYAVPTQSDADAVFDRYASDDVVTRFMSFPRHRSLDDARAFVSWSTEQWSARGVGAYLIRERGEGRLLGSTGLHVLSEPGVATTGYILARDAWGLGYATEAARTMVDLARRLGFRALEAPCHPDNAGSRRVLEKCGFTATRTEPFVFPNLGGGAVDSPVYRLELVAQRG